MTASRHPIVVVGASMAGLRACEQLRAAGWDGPLVCVGDEPHLPYNRPPLSKQVDTRPAGIEEWFSLNAFRRRPSVSDVQWILGTAATGADLAAHTVNLSDGRVLRYAGLVIATGLRARRLTCRQGWSARHVLRSIDDAAALYSRFAPGRRIAIVGGGFIGCELAITARSHGCSVTVIEPQHAPMSAALGHELGDAIRAHHAGSGIEFRTGVGVTALRDEQDGVRLEMSDTTALHADLVIESIGSHPNVEWLDGNGLDLSDGVLCDDRLAAIGAENVVAVGDVARFPNRRFASAARRVEHWCMPNDSAKYAARTLVAQLTGADQQPQPFSPLPTFWSDQGEVRIQGLGIPALADRSEIAWSAANDDLMAGVTVQYFAADQPVGTVTVNLPAGQLTAHRAALTEATNPFSSTAGAAK